MRVLALTRYGNQAASARLRFHQFDAGLRARGIELHMASLLNDEQVRASLAGRRPSLGAVGRSYAERVWQLLGSRRWDLLVIQYELFPNLPAWFEQMLRAAGVPYVLDLDDAIYHYYDQHPRPVVRQLLGSKIGRVAAGARAVVAGSQYLVEFAGRFNRNVHYLPTVVDMDRHRLPLTWDDGRPFTVSWIGSPSTTRCLDEVKEAFQQLQRSGPLRLVLTGAGTDFRIPGVDVEHRPWTEDTEVDNILAGHVGVMPLPDEPFTRGKCAFKLIQYMACGLPSVASPVGANVDVVTPATGLLAGTTAEWVKALDELRRDPVKRESMGRAGRVRAEELYSVQARMPELAEIWMGAARR